jgi:alpha-galactosidase
LGWNSWNAFGCDVDSTKIMTAANEMVNLGLKDLGYEYVNSEFTTLLCTSDCVSNLAIWDCIVDDCWSVKNTRNSTTQRIIPDTSKFPNGISGVADQVHQLGLKIGIYSSE